ncbi:NAD(P)/FAD-dependent oxidoreductase [Pinibacter aurantiacus]|uniref:FAD-dependent oxidoreductase n=1 Tax=Pinibacter aurantiacus TaxID=2851599 RepID=A0A9E2SES8_9BACT|nr:FAD-dependent oxidoreductase [Pinibacter aurantiacus]MBV4359360.1 FAD-dependent oxidoreductase [Pinibacter aurantiacus]
MQKTISIKLLPSEAADDQIIKEYIAGETGKPLSQINGFHIMKQSLDARSRKVWCNLTVHAFINEPFQERMVKKIELRNVASASDKVIVIGAGPCGLFAALKLIEQGIQPIILERGKDVRARRRDLAAMNKEGIVNPESNYCFGEGGAGTYSDGKLYTRSSKRGDIDRILNILVQYGADEKILYQAHPHIGTNKLPHIITAIREAIKDAGGIFLFEQKVSDFIVGGNIITGVKTAVGDTFEGKAVILATGHSARDIFQLLDRKKILIEQKPFALGVRIEHPQELIDSIQYHCALRGDFLPPASYSLVQQVEGRGVFSFCMCPGGIIAPAATDHNEIVVNGWSPSKRNNPFANSGMVVSVEIADIAASKEFAKQHDVNSPLAAMYFQQMVEQKAYKAGGGALVAPAQRMADFSKNKLSATLPDCSYLPGLHSASLKEVLPPFVYKGLSEGFIAFGKKMPGYFTNDAVVVATESRTSSPVRIPRNKTDLQHPQIKNLYPAGEGAGYAGGIVSAAMDGERVAEAILMAINN